MIVDETPKIHSRNGLVCRWVGASGRVSWSEGRFVGDSPTTTDIVGPWYRPGAPFRTNLNPSGFKGEILQLSGTVFKEDSKTPMNNCLNQSVKKQLVKEWQRARAYTLEYLDVMPTDKYGFKAQDSVRSFAQQMLHLAQDHCHHGFTRNG